MSHLTPLQQPSPSAAGGRIELIVGPMFSGKTTELLRRVVRFGYAKKKTLLIKYAADTRYSESCVCTHDQRKIKAVSAFKLENVEDRMKDFDVIGIDEGQFFEDLVEVAFRAAESGKIVIVAALDGTFDRKPFGRLCELFPHAESVQKLTAVCKLCGMDASFSRRLTASKETVAIGGADMYIPVCRPCFNRPVQQTRNDLKTTTEEHATSNNESENSAKTAVEPKNNTIKFPISPNTVIGLDSSSKKSDAQPKAAAGRAKSMISPEHVPKVLLTDA